MSEPLILFTEWYVDKDPVRRAELWSALVCNIDNPRVGLIYVMGDHQDLMHAPEHRKIFPQVVWERPSFAHMFQIAAAEQPGALCAIANSDIYFDRTLAALDDVGDFTDLVFCLSRWDMQPDGEATFRDTHISQDAWIFRSPLRLDHATFLMGQRGCDNRLAYELGRAGKRLCNPALTIRANHLHMSQRRGAKVVVPPPYMSVRPTTLEEGLAACRR